MSFRPVRRRAESRPHFNRILAIGVNRAMAGESIGTPLAVDGLTLTMQVLDLQYLSAESRLNLDTLSDALIKMNLARVSKATQQHQQSQAADQKTFFRRVWEDQRPFTHTLFYFQEPDSSRVWEENLWKHFNWISDSAKTEYPGDIYKEMVISRSLYDLFALDQRVMGVPALPFVPSDISERLYGKDRDWKVTRFLVDGLVLWMGAFNNQQNREKRLISGMTENLSFGAEFLRVAFDALLRVGIEHKRNRTEDPNETNMVVDWVLISKYMADAADNVASVCMPNRDKFLTSYPSLLGKQKAQTVYAKFSFGDDPSRMEAFDNRLREERLKT